MPLDNGLLLLWILLNLQKKNTIKCCFYRFIVLLLQNTLTAILFGMKRVARLLRELINTDKYDL